MGVAGPHAPVKEGHTEGRGFAIRALMPKADEVAFMGDFIRRVNPALFIEDRHCAEGLPEAIYQQSRAIGEDWIRVFALAWQESAFDCHAKNRFDPGGAYGPFQIRRLWEPLVGDPRHRYYDPELAVERVTRVIRYYQQTPRFRKLVSQGHGAPLLCLYNSGEVLQINTRYCTQVRAKYAAVRGAWEAYLEAVPAPLGLRWRASLSAMSHP